MKTHFIRYLLPVAAIFLAATVSGADKPAKETNATKSGDKPALAIIISDNLQNPGSAFTDFDRLDIAFHEVAKKRDWPEKFAVDRFAAGVPDYETEVRIFSQPVRRELPGELLYRAWVSVYVKGSKKHDFGIVTYRFYPRLGENTSETLDKLFLGFANAAADKLEPVLFPKADKPAPPKS